MTENSERKREPRRRSSGTWTAGKSGNPKGGPKRGESWAEIIKHVANMDGAQAAAMAKQWATSFKGFEGVTLKEAVVLRVFVSLLNEPTPGLLTAFMERAEGKLAQTVRHDVGDELTRLMRENGLTDNDIQSDPVASELFRLAGVRVGVSQETDSGISGEEDAGK